MFSEYVPMNSGVTIGIPVYSEQDRIERCIRAVAPQCDKLIIADNFFTDDTDHLALGNAFLCAFVQ